MSDEPSEKIKMTSQFRAMIRLLRPSHWIKNAFVFLPLFFNGMILNVALLCRATAVFLSFCFVASSIYCLNDIRDVEADKKHERKKLRPIASGEISVLTAYALMVASLLVGVMLLFLLKEARLPVLLIVGTYWLLNVLYCLKLKRVAVLDVLILASGYVFRLIAGGIACEIPLTNWIVLMTYLLSLFLSLAKRRDDVLILQRTGTAPRANTERYNLEFINQSLTITTSITLFCYIMYTLSQEVMERFNSRLLYVTAIFVLSGFLRYLQLSLVDQKSGDPVKILLHDRVLQMVVLLWLLSFILIIYCL